MVVTPTSNQLDQNQEKDLDLEPPYQPLYSRPTTPSSHISSPYHHYSLSHPYSPHQVTMPLDPRLASEIKSHPLF